MNKRIIRLQDSINSNNNIDAYFVTKEINVSYLMARPCEDAWLLVTSKKVFYITDSRYVLKAKQDFKSVNVIVYKTSLMKTIRDIVCENNIIRLGFNSRNISCYFYLGLKKEFSKKVKLIQKNNFVEKLRSIKSSEEVQKIRAALKVHAKAHSYLKRIIVPGQTERMISMKLENYIRAKGVSFSFPPIIASGPNSCFPHAKITDRKIRKNDMVLVDMGIEKYGYKSDLTRMFFLGKIPKLIRETHKIVCASQAKAIEFLRAGVRGSEVDHQARNYLLKKKLEKYFSHALGHSVGLEVHESPCLSKNDSTILQKGMILTVEPAVYVPNKFGIRVEDMVLITEKGCEVLSDNIY